MNFYTGISTIALFNVIFLLIIPFLVKLIYGRGPKHVQNTSKLKRRFQSTKYRKLSHRDEFFLTLMRLRLGILNKDIAERFGISPTTSSNIFSTWIKLISNVLGSALIVLLLHETIRENLPRVFKDAGYYRCCVIIDCAEVFIERINGFITFLSDCYGGRCSDKLITKGSGFYDLLERDDEVMADRGFQIQEELLLGFCTLIIPPGARLKSQMIASEFKKTKKVANLRIHVERVINRMKTYRILKNVLPLTILRHVDDIVRACAALCNLKPVLVNNSRDKNIRAQSR
ncbi:uncharacterized protein LOC124813937 [Hydra vulgaris]|uniref:uncharacterized protein LOC124813937 n=1 Tax=Hydra vulgaris TaxID=6087 RepID=UPI001F5EA9FE|nr:uncharacterized protein LOC124813937 [Hydra vulgaris]